jgi:hypothetical protein
VQGISEKGHDSGKIPTWQHFLGYAFVKLFSPHPRFWLTSSPLNGGVSDRRTFAIGQPNWVRMPILAQLVCQGSASWPPWWVWQGLFQPCTSRGQTIMQSNPNPSSGVNLTPTERRLLDLLRSNPGQVYSRAELVALVIGDALVGERTIDVHIRALRKKLDPHAHNIRTIRKAGYCFVP